MAVPAWHGEGGYLGNSIEEAGVDVSSGLLGQLCSLDLQGLPQRPHLHSPLPALHSGTSNNGVINRKSVTVMTRERLTETVDMLAFLAHCGRGTCRTILLFWSCLSSVPYVYAANLTVTQCHIADCTSKINPTDTTCNKGHPK